MPAGARGTPSEAAGRAARIRSRIISSRVTTSLVSNSCSLVDADRQQRSDAIGQQAGIAD